MAPRSVLAAMAMLALASLAHAQECLHGPNETAEDAERRQAAIRVAHAINAAQAAAIAANPAAAYKRAGDLNLSGIPDNFAFTLFINGRTTYAFSLKDFADPCYYAVFSDQDGHVYATHPEPEGTTLVSAPPARTQRGGLISVSSDHGGDQRRPARRRTPQDSPRRDK